MSDLLPVDPAPVAQPPAGVGAPELIKRIRESTDRLEADRLDPGDLKILSRSIRELRCAFNAFAPFRGVRKATIFGSARTVPGDPAYRQACELGEALADNGWMVITGAGGGIMQAGHEGAGAAASLGVNILLPFEQAANPVIAGDPKLVNMKYFFTRKLMFVKECDGVVCLPGGFGTLDEAMEVLTLIQTGKREMLPVILLDPPGQGYWDDWLAFVDKHLSAAGKVSPEDRSLYHVTTSVQDTVDELLGFYRVFHSMRYVGRRLVIRLKRRLPQAAVDSLGRDYSAILGSAGISQSEALPEESGDAAAAGLPRLVLDFDRRSHGRLRQLINAVNQAA